MAVKVTAVVLFHDKTIDTAMDEMQQHAIAVQVEKGIASGNQVVITGRMRQGVQVAPLANQVKIFPVLALLTNHQGAVPGPGLDLVLLERLHEALVVSVGRLPLTAGTLATAQLEGKTGTFSLFQSADFRA